MLGEGIVFSWVSLSGVFGQSLNEEGVKGVFTKESEYLLSSIVEGILGKESSTLAFCAVTGVITRLCKRETF